MGLDMYLKAQKYVSSWNHQKDAEAGKIFVDILNAVGMSMSDVTPDAPSGNVSFNVGYWRKANAIHSWFVGECQGGVDECQTSEVSREDLVKLKGLCEQALANPDKAEEILAPKGGFFFGSTEIDEWYMADLKQTIAICDKCLSPKFEGWTFTYRSSW